MIIYASKLVGWQSQNKIYYETLNNKSQKASWESEKDKESKRES